jgi:N-acylneuraminate cytidylyltransferase
MIAHSILAAVESGCFSQVVVSTDDAEIAEVAKSYGAEVPFVRPAALADDHTGTTAVVQHALRRLIDAGATWEYACCLYATAPFVNGDLLRRGLDILKAHDSSYAFSVARFSSPIQRALRVRSDGTVQPFWPENVSSRSQDLEPAFHDAGQFYWGKIHAWLEGRQIHSPLSVPVFIPGHRVQDIDTPDDWIRAEILYAALNREEKA